jgi:hypothetical protein
MAGSVSKAARAACSAAEDALPPGLPNPLIAVEMQWLVLFREIAALKDSERIAGTESVGVLPPIALGD